MALPDLNSPNLAFDPALAAKSFHDTAQIHDSLSAALARLPLLRQEAGRNFHLARFLARSPRACLALMLMTIVALALGSAYRGGSLRADFAWGAAVLAGILAMTRNYIRGHARSLRRVTLEEAASDLRVILLYSGAAWGVGAFLVMPDQPAPAVAFGFAIAPSLAIAMTLRDRKGATGFVAPACLTTAGAAVLGAWPFDIWVGATILTFGACIICQPMLRCAIGQYETSLPR
jgi:hypothetical protein